MEGDDNVILLSSESSAPTSPACEVADNGSFDIAIHVDSDDNSESTVEYFPCVGSTKETISTDINTLLIKETVHKSCSNEELCDNGIASSFDNNYVSNVITATEIKSSSVSINQNTAVSSISSVNLKRKEHELSDSEDSDAVREECDEYLKNIFNRRSKSPSPTRILNGNTSPKGKRKGRPKNTEANEEKEKKKTERLEKRAQKQAEIAQNKAIKLASVDAYRSKKPGECLKYIRVCLDHQLLVAEYGGELLVALQSAEMQYDIQSNPIPLSIYWTRKIQQHSVGTDMKVQVTAQEKEEEELILVWSWDKVLRLVQSRTLTNEIKTLQSVSPDKKFTLVIYGAKKYFRHHTILKRRDVREQVLGAEGKTKTTKKELQFENAPKVSRDDWEMAMTELQLFANCSHRLIDDPPVLGTFIRQFTKAIAEVPFKHEKHKREQEKLHWYATGDSRDCVRVDKNGNGLLRLWQQQLCQFNRVSMEIAQAISSVYQSPSALVQAYENCSNEREAELLLESIPVRRGVGPLASVKKIGPELSKKVHALFTAVDGKIGLSQD